MLKELVEFQMLIHHHHYLEVLEVVLFAMSNLQVVLLAEKYLLQYLMTMHYSLLLLMRYLEHLSLKQLRDLQSFNS